LHPIAGISIFGKYLKGIARSSATFHLLFPQKI
jgi:hypothetical protein